MTVPIGAARRAAHYALYYGLARQLPWSINPGGHLWKRVRARACRGLFDSCGEDVNIEQGAWFGSGRGIEVGDRSGIGKDARLLGPVTIAADVMMGPSCILLASTHAYTSVAVPMNRQGMGKKQRILIEDDVWIGAASVILPGIRLGQGSIIAAGAVVTRDVDPYTVVGGNPARFIKKRNE